jgi:hypothetical protein
MANIVSPQEAVQWAESFAGTSGLPTGRCDHSTAVAYTPGHSWVNSHSNSTSAIDHWNWIVAHHPEDVHMGDTNPPPGALVFWQGGDYGHATVSTGNGNVGSTDISGAGTYSVVPIKRINTTWGNLKYLGWTNADFQDGRQGPDLSIPGASGPSGVATGGLSSVGGGNFPNPNGSSNGLVDVGGGTGFGATNVNPGTDSTIVRILKIGGGVGLIIIGLVLLLRKPIGQAADLGAGLALSTTPTGNVAKTFLKGRATNASQERINARQESGQLFRTGERQARQTFATERSETLFNQRAESAKSNQDFKLKFNAENWKKKEAFQARGNANSTARSVFVGQRNAAAEATRQANRTTSENLRQSNRIFNINKRQRAKAEDQVVSKLIKNMSIDEILGKAKPKPAPKPKARAHGNKAKPEDFGLTG